jgi:hypothetical protein
MPKRLVLAVCAVLLIASGCKVDTTVSIHMRSDGSGVVRITADLDPAAVRAAEAGGGKLEDRIRLGDLTKGGWQVQPWKRAADGSAQLVLTKPFDAPSEVAGIVREISGTTGPLRDVTVTRDHGALSTKYRATGTLDLAKLQTGLTSDPDVVNSLTGQKVDVNGVDRALLGQLADSLQVRVRIALPGGTTTVIGKPGVSSPIDASSSVLDKRRILLLAGAVLLVVLAVLVLVWPGRRRRRRRARSRVRI